MVGAVPTSNGPMGVQWRSLRFPKTWVFLDGLQLLIYTLLIVCVFGIIHPLKHVLLGTADPWKNEHAWAQFTQGTTHIVYSCNLNLKSSALDLIRPQVLEVISA